jgi:hypothetical protein
MIRKAGWRKQQGTYKVRPLANFKKMLDAGKDFKTLTRGELNTALAKDTSKLLTMINE